MSFLVALSASGLFLLPMALFLFRFRTDAPFYFLAQDAFYYLSITRHSAHVAFFTLDGVHPTNGFHPLWEWFESALVHLAFFRLDGPEILPRIFAMDLAIVSSAVGLLSAFAFRLTGRFWISVLAFCPGLLWLVVGVGSPSYLNFWSNVNGMETGLELLFFSTALLLFRSDLQMGWRFLAGTCALAFLVLARLDDAFFVLAFILVVSASSPSRKERAASLLALLIPFVGLAAYLLYNHHSVGVWLPVSGAAKVGKGYRASVGESLRLLKGWPFFALETPREITAQFSNVFALVAQMIAPMLIAGTFLVVSRGVRTGLRASPLLRAAALGVLLKGGYNFLFVAVGYQGAWYYGASMATANVLLAILVAEMLRRWERAPSLAPSGMLPSAPRWLRHTAFFAAATAVSFLSFNITASRASQYGFNLTRDAWLERDTLRAKIQSLTQAPFLEFQDGELSFATGLPAVSAFGLAADPAMAKAQKNGTFFDLLQQRGITLAASSNGYPAALLASSQSKAIFPVWGFNREEIQHYCFAPFWVDPVGNIVLYQIRHEAHCPEAVGQ